MAEIDTMVVRGGKWISTCDTKPVPGEPCVDISDGFGYYHYALSVIPLDEDTTATIVDDDPSDTRRKPFDDALEKRGLPPFFKSTNF